ncbi:glycerol-3-phosphate dehydrogenase, partial [Escherichia coli]|nr:glycerol-3-phosphate dehydrogenase [Escherichia coli]
AGPCITKRLPISGGDVGGSAGYAVYAERKIKDGVALGLERAVAERLVRTYGSNVDRLYARLSGLRGGTEVHGMRIELFLMASYAMEEEMAATPADFWVRRTGA